MLNNTEDQKVGFRLDARVKLSGQAVKNETRLFLPLIHNLFSDLERNVPNLKSMLSKDFSCINDAVKLGEMLRHTEIFNGSEQFYYQNMYAINQINEGKDPLESIIYCVMNYFKNVDAIIKNEDKDVEEFLMITSVVYLPLMEHYIKLAKAESAISSHSEGIEKVKQSMANVKDEDEQDMDSSFEPSDVTFH